MSKENAQLKEQYLNWPTFVVWIPSLHWFRDPWLIRLLFTPKANMLTRDSWDKGARLQTMTVTAKILMPVCTLFWNPSFPLKMAFPCHKCNPFYHLTNDFVDFRLRIRSTCTLVCMRRRQGNPSLSAQFVIDATPIVYCAQAVVSGDIFIRNVFTLT